MIGIWIIFTKISNNKVLIGGKTADSVCTHTNSHYRVKWHLKEQMSTSQFKKTTWVGIGIK